MVGPRQDKPPCHLDSEVALVHCNGRVLERKVTALVSGSTITVGSCLSEILHLGL
jgi:hypothetical protein